MKKEEELRTNAPSHHRVIWLSKWNAIGLPDLATYHGIQNN